MLECAKLGRCVDAQRLGAKLLQPLDRRTLRRHFTLEYFGLFRQITNGSDEGRALRGRAIGTCFQLSEAGRRRL
jgi:hypothetical protein